MVEVGESFDDEPGLFKKVDVSGKTEEPEVNDTCAAATAFGGLMRFTMLRQNRTEKQKPSSKR